MSLRIRLVAATCLVAFVALVAAGIATYTAFSSSQLRQIDDVRNVGAIPGVATATAASIRRADAVIAVSDFLRRELEAKIPDAEGKVHVIDSGVDLTRFAHRDPAPLRAELGWERPGTHYLCVGTLDERKNVVRLAECS